MSAPTDDRIVVDLGNLLDAARQRIVDAEPVPPRESVCRLATALRTFGRELRAYVGAWLRDHRIGYVERAYGAGCVDGFRHGLEASPWRSAQ